MNITARPFLLTVLFQGGLGVLAIVLGALLGYQPLATVRLDAEAGRDLLYAMAATLPMLALFFGLLYAPWDFVRRMRAIAGPRLRLLLGPMSVPQLLVVAVLAGVGEELLFRGLIQTALAAYLTPPAALLVASVVFGVLHWLTPAYAVLASVLGAWLGWMYLYTDNLLVPIFMHTLYDFIAFVYYLRYVAPEAEAPAANGT